MDPNLTLYISVIVLAAGGLALLYYIYRRVLWLLRTVGSGHKKRPAIRHSIRNLIVLAFIISSGMTLLFAAFFTRSYQRFTREIPVAEVQVRPSPQPNTFYLTLITDPAQGNHEGTEYVIHGDQWMIEADIIKWDNWLSFLGMDTRYRLTRLRGRYEASIAERTKPPSVYAIDPLEEHPFWHHLYDFGDIFPFVSAVYGNAVYQYGNRERHFLIYVTTSGLMIRIEQD